MAIKKQAQTGRPIEYEEVIDKEDYVTGIARFDNPGYPGHFEMRVSGWAEDVERYSREANVMQMEAQPMGAAEIEEEMAGQRQGMLAGRRAELLDLMEAHCRRMQADLAHANPEMMMDAEALRRRMLADFQLLQKLEAGPEIEEGFNPETDRLIEVELVEFGDEYANWRVKLVLDPPFVPEGKKDIYAPVNANVDSTWGQVQAISGDPDLYLYRGGQKRDASVSSGASDAVSGSGGNGAWRLHVRGFTDATYDLFGDWVILVNN